MLSDWNAMASEFARMCGGSAGPRVARRMAELKNVARGATARAVLRMDLSMAFPTNGVDGVVGAGAEVGTPASTTPGCLGGVVCPGLAGAPFTSFGGVACAFFFVESLLEIRSADPSRRERGINIDCAV